MRLIFHEIKQTNLVIIFLVTVQNSESSAVAAIPTTRALRLPLDEEAVPLNPPSAERHETAKKKSTVWTVTQSGENRGR